MVACTGNTVHCDPVGEDCIPYGMLQQDSCFTTLFNSDCTNNTDEGGICEDPDSGIVYYNSDTSSECAGSCSTLEDDFWLSCTLNFPGTYPPGGDGPGGGGTGGPPPDDDDDNIPCEGTHCYWVCYEGKGEAGTGEAGPKTGWTTYTCEQTYCVDVTGANSTDCEPEDTVSLPGGGTGYYDKAACEDNCNAGTGGHGGGGGGGGVDDDFDNKYNCEGVAWKCDPTDGDCDSFGMKKTNSCFYKLFNDSCAPLKGKQGKCTDAAGNVWYSNKSTCDTWCFGDGGGGDGCVGDATYCDDSNKYNSQCTDYVQGDGTVGMPKTHNCFKPLFLPNTCNPKKGAGMCIDGGIKYFNKDSTSTNCGDPGTCDSVCTGKTVYCNPDTQNCDPSAMDQEHECFSTLFDSDCTNNTTGGGICEDSNKITYYNSDASSQCAGYCAPLATCTRWTCKNEGFPNKCYADGTDGGSINYEGSGFCITSSTVSCDSTLPNYDTCCACNGTYTSDPDLKQYATAMEALLDGKCVTCGNCGFGCPHSTPGASDCTTNCYDPQGNPLCHPDNKDLEYDSVIKDAKCVFDKNNWPTCWENYLGCTDPNTGCGSNGCTDYVICSETVCPALTYNAHPIHAGCGVVTTAGVCTQFTYGQCDYTNNTLLWGCADANGVLGVNNCKTAYGFGDPRNINDLYNDPILGFGGPPEVGIYQCDSRITDPNDPNYAFSCISVKANKCKADPNTPCGQGSGKGFGDNCWECSPSTDTCCSQTARGKRSRGGTLVCPEGSWPTEQSCKETCMHNCYKCDTFNTAKTISIPCSTPCSEKGRYDSLAEAIENCSIDKPEYPFPYFNKVALDRVYRPDIIDTVFQRNYSNQMYGVKSNFTPIVNSTFINKTIFRDNIHMGIRATHDINKKYLEEFSDFPYSNMSNSNIERSLRKDLVTLLDKVKLATGESIKPYMLNTIKSLIVSDRIDVIDGDELVLSLQSILDQQINYPDTRGTVVQVRGTHSSEAKALKLATEKSYYLKDDSYGQLAKERLKLWKTLAPDLNKNLAVRGSSGVVTPLYFAIDDTIVLGGSGTLTMSDGDLIKVRGSNGAIKEISVQGDYDRAKIIQLEDLQKIIFLLGEKYNFKMEVTTDPTLRVDERYGVTDPRKDFYLLKAEVSGITDLPRKNAFVAQTEVKYTYMKSTSTRSDWVKFKPWPYMVFYVDWADPIISYIINGGTIKITSKDFVFDMFDNEELVQFPRRIPFTVAIIPTNKVDNLTYPSISKQSSYGVREITFEVNQDPKKSDSWEPVYLKESRSWPSPGVEENKKDDFFALDYSMAPKKVRDSIRYQNDNVQPTIERPMFGMRQILKQLKEYKDNWVLRNNKDVMWYDVYDKMDRSKMKFLFTECVNWENQKSLFLMGKISSDATVNANYPRVRDVRSDGKPITDNFFNTHTVLQEKPLEDQIVEPDPLP